jgi:hypothetical protein
MLMKRRLPDFSCGLRGGVLTCDGELQPTPMCDLYRIRVTYKLGNEPEVHVLQPALRDRSSTESIPHVYPGNRLCLFFPGGGEWRPLDPIADTIIPWTATWLYFYEVWLTTGRWRGEGKHPKSSTDRSDK